MTRGISLLDDLKYILNNQQYSDVKIKCSDDKILYGCRILLAARCEILDGMLYNAKHEATSDEISFPEILSSTMKIILLYLYTGETNKDNLDSRNAINVLHAANFLHLPSLETFVSNFIDSLLKSKQNTFNVVHLFSSVVVKYKSRLDKQNPVIKRIYKKMIAIQLDTIPYDMVPYNMLDVLLSQVSAKDESFVTNEYGILRYVILWGAKEISFEALNNFSKLLPNEKSIAKYCREKNVDAHRVSVDSTISTIGNVRNHLIKKIKGLLLYIHLELIPAKILGCVIDPLKILPEDRLLKAYRFHSIRPQDNSLITHRGFMFKWDQTACGSILILSNDKTEVEAVSAHRHVQSIRAMQALFDKQTIEWDILIQKIGKLISVGVCTEECDFSKNLSIQSTGWCMSSTGSYYHNNISTKYELPPFIEKDIITIHLDMTQRTCAFSINGNRMKTAFSNLPEKIYPALELETGAKAQIIYKAN
ncbi:2348_t:CDS:1 [Ambispora gerdemannii]|uniref:2348_t:CDS:1 n=1 Tax=Ambispora gerdemannii TaxID=144530 RepID=A0A9N9GI46_9GLOM|nr:2348_t:CDS:1 [Ambispora gerdemannii]